MNILDHNSLGATANKLTFFLLLDVGEAEIRQYLYQRHWVDADWPLYLGTALDAIQESGPRLIQTSMSLADLSQLPIEHDEWGLVLQVKGSIEDIHSNLSSLTLATYQQDAVIFRWFDPRVLHSLVLSWHEVKFGQFFGDISQVIYRRDNVWCYVRNPQLPQSKLSRPWLLDESQLAHYQQSRYYPQLLASNFIERWLKFDPPKFAVWLRQYKDLSAWVSEMITQAQAQGFEAESTVERYCVARLKYKLTDLDCAAFKARTTSVDAWLALMETGQKEVIDAVS